MEENISFLFALRKRPFPESLFLFSLVDFFHPLNMFLFHVLGLSFEGVRDSLLLLICFLLCLVFGTQPSFGPTCLLCLHCLDSLSSLFEFFFVFLLVWCFLWVLACFLSILVVILGLSFLDCSVLMLLLLLRVLAARLCVWFLGCLLAGTLRGGHMDMANREGSIYFSGFLIVGVFG